MNVTAHLPQSGAALGCATSVQRDRYLDLLRALSITVVVAGHWASALLWIDDGRLSVGSVTDVVPATRWVTWIVQVMPVFFLVGAVVNARSWRRASAAGRSYATWLAQRGARLLRPTTVVVWSWAALAPVLLLAGVPRQLLQLATTGALVPLWFLAVYLLLVALVPLLLAAHDRLGLKLPAAVALVVAGVDALHRADVSLVGLTNYLLVWSIPTLLGFCWTDGLLERRAVRWALPVGGLTLLIVAVTWWGYPVSMVGLAEAGVQPPALPLALLGCVQTGAVLALRAPAVRWLQRPRVWHAVVRLNLRAMTVYLWHLTILVALAGLLVLSGDWWSVAPHTPAWWLSRPLWVLALALCLAPVTRVLGLIELATPRVAPRPASPSAAAGVVMAVVAACGGIASLTLGGAVGARALASTLMLTAAALHCGAFGTPNTKAEA